jgi:type VI protein secretion system component VasF
MRKTVSEIDEAVVNAEKTVGSVNEASASLAEAGKAWEPTIRELNRLAYPPEDPDEPPSDTEPFQVPHVTEAANALTGTATELRTLLSDLRSFLDADEMPAALADADATAKSSVDHATERAYDLTDHVTWRAVQLIVVLLVGLLGYRFASVRMRMSRP